MSSLGYDNSVYEEISSETKNTEENTRYEVPRKIISENEIPSFHSKNNICLTALTLAVLILSLVVVAACVSFALEIGRLKTEISKFENMVYLNHTTTLQETFDMLSEGLDNVSLQTSRFEMISLNHTTSLQQTLDAISQRLDNEVIQDYSPGYMTTGFFYQCFFSTV